MSDPAFPASAGQWTLTGDRLRCRLPRRTVEIEAPAGLLAAVSDVCDGTRDWDTALAALGDRWEVGAVQRFLRGLAASGVLVDGSTQVAVAAELGWTPTIGSRPLAAEALPAHRLSLQEPLYRPADRTHAATPSAFGDRLARRRTPGTFGDAAVSGQALVNILWAMYGITHCADGTAWRTIPSAGGLYAIDWYCALLRANDRFEPGLYKVRHHARGAEAGHVSLERLAGQASDAWATLLAPAILSHASAALFPVARLDDIAAKYANRALTFALIEVGHACQSGALAALDEGAASASRGDTIETEVQRLFALGKGSYPTPAWILGSAPTEAVTALSAGVSAAFSIASVPAVARRLEVSSFLASAGPIRISSRPPFEIWASGRSTDPRLAAIKAEAEGWERLGWASPRQLVHGTQSTLAGAIDPRLFTAYSDNQYRRAAFPFDRWSPRTDSYWTPGIDVASGEPVLLLAQTVHSLGALPEAAAAHPFTNASTSGMAAWTSPEGAVTRAVVELIERDAFVRAWLAQQALPCIHTSVCASGIRVRLAHLQAAGYDVTIRRMPSHLLPAVMIVARRRSHAFASVTTGAGFSLDAAVESALLETESKVQDAHGKPALPDFDCRRVRSHRDHGHYFRTVRGHADADVLLATDEIVDASALARDAASAPADGPALLRALSAAGMSVYACDLTPPGASTSQGRTPLHVWRAFVTGLVPLWFGHGLEPWALIERLGVPVSAALRRSAKIHPCT